MTKYEQLQYDEIIEKAKYTLEDLSSMGKFKYVSNSADYSLEEDAHLVFKSSHESIGIQAADLLAGFVMRFVNERLKITHDRTILATHKLLMTMNNEKQGIGLNMVMSYKDVDLINTLANR